MSVDPSDYNDDQEFEIPGSGENAGSLYDFADGDYPLVLVDLKKDKSKVKEDGTGGNDMFVWVFRGLPDSGLPQATFNLYTAITPRAMFKVQEVTVALGLRAQDDVTSTIKIKKKDAIGRRCVGSFRGEVYQGKKTSKLQRVSAHPQGPGPIELTPDDMPF